MFVKRTRSNRQTETHAGKLNVIQVKKNKVHASDGFTSQLHFLTKDVKQLYHRIRVSNSMVTIKEFTIVETPDTFNCFPREY